MDAYTVRNQRLTSRYSQRAQAPVADLKRSAKKDSAMITKEKLAIYKSYRGNVDGWARAHKKSERLIADADWRRIDELLLQLGLVKKKLAAEVFAAEAQRRLQEEAADAEV